MTATNPFRTIAYGHDAAGNRTQVIDSQGGINYYEWTALSQMSMADANGQILTMTYNAHRQRVARANPDGSIDRFLYDNAKNLLQQTDEDNDPTISYTVINEEYGDLLGQYNEMELDGDPPGEYYRQFDAQSSLNALMDSSGGVVQTYKYQAFGLPAGNSNYGWQNLTVNEWSTMTVAEWSALPVNPPASSVSQTYVGLKGYYLDPLTELYLLGGGGEGRYYDAVSGQFISEDPIRQNGGDDNLFRYVWNNPVIMIDPSGQWPGWLDDAASYVADKAEAAGSAVVSGAQAVAEVAVHAVQSVGGFVLDGIEAAAMTAFNAVLSTAGIDAAGFTATLKQWASDIPGTLKALITRSGAILEDLLHGVLRGVSNFVGSKDDNPAHFDIMAILKNVVSALESWLGIPGIGEFVSKLLSGGKDIFDTVINEVLKIIGLDWDSILGLVGQALGDDTLVMRVVAWVGEAMDNASDLGGWIMKKVGSAIEGMTDWVKNLPGQLGGYLWDTIQGVIPGIVADVVGGLVAKFAGPAKKQEDMHFDRSGRRDFSALAMGWPRWPEGLFAN